MAFTNIRNFWPSVAFVAVFTLLTPSPSTAASLFNGQIYRRAATLSTPPRVTCDEGYQWSVIPSTVPYVSWATCCPTGYKGTSAKVVEGLDLVTVFCCPAVNSRDHCDQVLPLQPLSCPKGWEMVGVQCQTV